jgi:hypothetical protein
MTEFFQSVHYTILQGEEIDTLEHSFGMEDYQDEEKKMAHVTSRRRLGARSTARKSMGFQYWNRAQTVKVEHAGKPSGVRRRFTTGVESLTGQAAMLAASH